MDNETVKCEFNLPIIGEILKYLGSIELRLRKLEETNSVNSPHSSAVEHVSRKTSAEASSVLVGGSTPSGDATHKESVWGKKNDGRGI